jgi:hypothetical protein
VQDSSSRSGDTNSKAILLAIFTPPHPEIVEG